MYTKGAESHVLPLCSPYQRSLIGMTQAHINDYACLGLRTLAVARRKLSRDEYADFFNGNQLQSSRLSFLYNLHVICFADIMAASSAIVDRKALIEAVQEKIENSEL